MKPVELVERAMRNSTTTGDIVYDPFVGSGTTLIAAEQLGRRCYAIDIDPRYVQVAKERWEAFTGLTAVKEESADARSATQAARPARPAHGRAAAGAGDPPDAAAGSHRASRAAPRSGVVAAGGAGVDGLLAVGPGPHGAAVARHGATAPVRLLRTAPALRTDRRPEPTHPGLDGPDGHEPAAQTGRRARRQDPGVGGPLRRVADGPAAPPGDVR